MRGPPQLLLLLALALCVLAPGCAWANRDNRPLWNAYEEHVVPEGDVAFYATLPLTIPGGIVAILLDTFVVHPAMVADDAGHDAGHLWDDMRWREAYYTELASLPLRAVATPLAFVMSFLTRSLFDLPDHRCPWVEAGAPADEGSTEGSSDGG